MKLPQSPKLLLDFGQVLTLEQDQRVFASILQEWHCSSETFFAAWKHFRPAYDLGELEPRHYWQAVRLAVHKSNGSAATTSALSENDLSGLIHTDLQSFARPRLAIHHLVQHCLDLHIPVGILSNMPPEHGERWKETWPWLQRCSLCVWSGEEGMGKPDPLIYRLMLDRSGWPAADILFVDDVLANIAAAREAGMSAHHFIDENAAVACIQQWVGLHP
jgi:FMN phosphatase YigB (HAD superfamily)